MNRYILILLTVLVGSLLLIGCSNSEYKVFKEKYEKIYFEITDVVVPSDISLTLERLQEDSIKNKISELNKLLISIQDNVSDNQKEHYEEMKRWYDGLTLLRSYYGEANLSFDDNRKILREIISIDLRRERYNIED